MQGLADWSDIDWGDIISTGIKSTPTIISAARGQSYGATPQGMPTGGYAGGAQQGFFSSGSVGGIGGSLGISPNMLLLLGLGFLGVMMMRGR